MIQILIVDDDANIRELLQHFLQTQGFVVTEAIDGKEALSILSNKKIHLAVVDIMMPNMDGFELCEEIKQFYDIPVILLTAKDQLVDKERGYLTGTDDYLTKPFEPKELLFRIKALLRRFQIVNNNVIYIGQTTIDRNSYEIHCNRKLLLLPLKEFDLLSQLASYPNRIFTRQELIENIWGRDFSGDDRTVDVHIKRIRERFSTLTDDFAIITVRGIGYKLEVLNK
ncbi:response regulator transcription factor [Cytobacillus sp. Hm23]